MAACEDFPHVIKQLRSTDYPEKVMRDLVISAGGHWTDQSTQTLFENHYMEITGVGVGSMAAIENWVANAERKIGIDTKT